MKMTNKSLGNRGIAILALITDVVLCILLYWLVFKETQDYVTALAGPLAFLVLLALALLLGRKRQSDVYKGLKELFYSPARRKEAN